MKKVLSCLLAVLLLASFCAMAFADEAVPSVEADTNDPTVVAPTDDDSGAIIITDYADKDKLPEDAEKQLDAAYDALQDLAGVVENTNGLKELLDGAEVDCESLFDISVVGDITLPVEVQLELVNPEHFAALLHFVDGKATLVPCVVKDGVLTMTLQEVGSYAILSYAEEGVVIITDYADKDTLSEAAEKQLDAAYEALQDLAGLVDGNDELKELLGGAEAVCESLVDIDAVENTPLPVAVQLELVNPDQFAALLHFVDGEATLVPAEVDDGNLLMTLSEVGSYAVLSFAEAK